MFYSTGPHGNAHQAKLAFTANAAADAEGLRTLYSKSNQRSPDQFINALSNPRVGHYFNGGQAGVLFKVADVENKNRITLEQFLNFEKLFESPFAEYTILAKLIDPASKNMTVGSLKSFFKHSPLSEPTIDFNCDPLKLTLGSDDKRVISIEELSHIVRVIRNELIRHEYATLDPKKTGSINGAALQSALTSLAGHKLNPTVKQKIATNFNIATFAEFVALLTVLSRTDSIARVLAVAKSKADNSVTAEGFALSNMKEKDDQFTPLEIRMMFKIINGDNSTVQNSDSFAPLIDPSYVPNESVKITSLSAGMQTLKSVYSFALGSIGGAVGAAAVYPIDLVKTRMQNQRKGLGNKMVGQILYKNGIDCFKKVLKNEGVAGLYSGIIPQLVGVAPEKAIKLTMNDLMRTILKDKKSGELPFYAEVLAGCVAGGSQVMFTNPLEIVKIRLQVQGEVAKAGVAVEKQTALHIVRQLGLFGLYKGVGACLLRDIPFSAIYFPVYSHLKKDVFNEGKNGKKLEISELLISGALAGIPAAYLVTPADVIKTRLQVAARKGEQTYSGMRDAFVKILREEGPMAFYKGGVARVLRSSPQFGVTLAVYEFLQKNSPIKFGDELPDRSSAPSQKWSSFDIGKQNSLTLLGDLALKSP